MKKLLLIGVLCGVAGLSFGQIQYTIEGTVVNAPEGEKAYIYRMGAGPADSALIREGAFQFVGKGNPGTQIYLSRQASGPMDPKGGTTVYIDEGLLKVAVDYADFSKTKVE